MRVVVTGGRAYGDRDAVFRTLDILNLGYGDDALAHGACGWDAADPAPLLNRLRGADRWADEWARENGRVEQRRYPCGWAAGEAGPARNRRMLTDFRPDLVIAFPGGRGTDSCVRIARELGVLVWRVVP